MIMKKHSFNPDLSGDEKKQYASEITVIELLKLADKLKIGKIEALVLSASDGDSTLMITWGKQDLMALALAKLQAKITMDLIAQIPVV
jgi:hypothetical protein